MNRPDLLARLAARSAARARTHLLRHLAVNDEVHGPYLVRGGRRLLAFCSNDYLGLARHPAIVAALQQAADELGVGSTSAHLICGHHREHALLEEALATWTGRERALLFSTGWMANQGVLGALLARGDLCLQDKLNHASLLDAAQLSGATLRRYPHADVAAAARRLDGADGAATLLATDGVFSMDGDSAPLPALATLAAHEGATLMVDDAHGFGVLGASGAGSLEAAGLGQAEVPVLMATLGKALGTAGAFVAGPAALIEGLTQFARSFVYTTAMPPALAAATRAAVLLARGESWRRARLTALIRRFRAGAGELGLPLAASASAIQPLLLGSAARALEVAAALQQRGILVTAIRPPSVPQGAARLRITLSAAHAETDVDHLLDALSDMALSDVAQGAQAAAPVE